METDIAPLLHTALGDEPEFRLDAATVMTAAVRRRRRRRSAAAAAASLAAAAAVIAVFALANGDAQPARQPQVESLAAAKHLLSSPHPARQTGGGGQPITRASLPGVVERIAHVRLDDIQTENEQGVSMYAGLASARDQNIAISVNNPHVVRTTLLNCADLNGDGPNGDRYYGPCSVRVLRDGTQLVIRDVRTASGKYAKTEADIINPDGSAVFAEADNQQARNPSTPITLDKHGRFVIPPVVSAEPALTTDDLVSLVRTLSAEAFGRR